MSVSVSHMSSSQNSRFATQKSVDLASTLEEFKLFRGILYFKFLSIQLFKNDKFSGVYEKHRNEIRFQ